MSASPPNNALAIVRPRAIGLSNLTDDQKALLKRTVCKGATDDEFALFVGVAERCGLDPFTKQIHAVRRKSKDPTTGHYVEGMTIQVGIDGFRLIAQRTGEYEGQVGPWWCGPDGKWVDAWLDVKANPAAARIGVMRRGFREPLYAPATWASYAQFIDKECTTLAPKWRTMGDVMIAKCAEALALRRAFPQELSGLYTDEEMEQADTPIDTAKERADRLVAAADAAMKRGAVTVAAEVSAPLSLRADALTKLAALVAQAKAKQPWHVAAAQLIPQADERTLAELEAGTFRVEQAAREEAGEELLPITDAEHAAFRVFVWTRGTELGRMNKAAAEFLKRQHGADWIALDAAIRKAIALEKEKPGSSSPAAQDAAARHATGGGRVGSWSATDAGKAAGEANEAIVVPVEGGEVG